MTSNLDERLIRDGMHTQNLTDIQYAIIGGILASPEKAGSAIAKLPLSQCRNRHGGMGQRGPPHLWHLRLSG